MRAGTWAAAAIAGALAVAIAYAQMAPATGVTVSPETYVRAESDRQFGNIVKMAGGVNRLDVSDGWNYIMRIYRPGASVVDGTYKLPAVVPHT